MIAYQYDGTFEGLLCVLFEAYRRKKFPDAVRHATSGRAALCDTTVAIATDANNARRVFTALQKKLSGFALRQLLLVWLADAADREMPLLRYMRLVVDSQPFNEGDYAHPAVFAVHMLAKKVAGEAHLMKGFIRFQESAEGVFVSLIEPRYNILPLVLAHFMARFGGQRWLIYDAGRRYGYYFDGNALHDADIFPDHFTGGRMQESLLGANERLLQQLWQTYYGAASIAERSNPKLHRRCLPQRYWKHLTEKW